MRLPVRAASFCVIPESDPPKKKSIEIQGVNMPQGLRKKAGMGCRRLFPWF